MRDPSPNTLRGIDDLDERYDILLVGAGIMSATLAALLTLLDPDSRILVAERLPDVALESSGPWNNAGTGHSALCELNYTPRRPDGSIQIEKAVHVNEQFQVSRQFWASLVDSGDIPDPALFLHPVPHISFVTGDDGVAYLRARYEALADHPLFRGLEHARDRAQIASWIPLVMTGRAAAQPVAATRSTAGSDVDFGTLTRLLLQMATQRGAQLALETDVVDLARHGDEWAATLRDARTGMRRTVRARRVFVGAGGGALHLLQKARIPEISGYGGFPVSGRFLRCRRTDIVSRHTAKVYGRASVGAPPMSVPHLDTRIVDGERVLLFGPYAGFSPRFLKRGSLWDLPGSVRPGNLRPLLGVARRNLPLEKYLLSELARTRRGRFASLLEYFPEAHIDDWELLDAGQRVQIIKRDGRGRGTLQFGTEVVAARDGTLSGLLGASPGASTAVPIMLDVLRRCFPESWDSWESGLRRMIPTLGRRLSDDPQEARRVMRRTAETLGLQAE